MLEIKRLVGIEDDHVHDIGPIQKQSQHLLLIRF